VRSTETSSEDRRNLKPSPGENYDLAQGAVIEGRDVKEKGARLAKKRIGSTGEASVNPQHQKNHPKKKKTPTPQKKPTQNKPEQPNSHPKKNQKTTGHQKPKPPPRDALETLGPLHVSIHVQKSETPKEQCQGSD